MRRLLHAITVLAAVVVVTSAAVAAGAATPDPKRLTLRLADFREAGLPEGFRQASARYQSNQSQVDDGLATRSQLKAWGRLTGYEVVYRRKDGPPGVDVVVSGSDVFKTTEGARKSLAGFRVFLRKTGWKPMITQGPRGDEGYAFTAISQAEDGSLLKVALVAWRYRNFAGSVVIAGPLNMNNPLSVNSVSLAQQARMERVFVFG